MFVGFLWLLQSKYKQLDNGTPGRITHPQQFHEPIQPHCQTVSVEQWEQRC